MAIEKTINLNVNTKGAQKEVKNLEKAVEGVNEEVKETSASTKQMGGALDSATGGAISKFNGLKGTLKGVITSFKSLRVAIIATGIGALLIAITSLGQAFTRSEEGQNKFAKILGVIGSVVDNLLDLLADLGEGIINAFTNPVETIKGFANSIKTFVVDKITGTIDSIGLLGSAIKKVFSGDFKGALEDTKKGFKGLVDNSPYGIIRDGVKSATEAVKEFSKEVASDAENAAKIADARAKAEKMARNLIVERAEAERKIAEIREKAADKENFTAAERIELLKEAGAISEDLANKETEVARIKLDAKVLENSLAKSNKQALDEEAQLKADLINKETRRLKLQKALTAEVTTAVREEAAAVKAAEAKKKAEKDKAKKAETDRLNAIKKIRDDFAAKVKEQEAETELEKLAVEEEKKLAELDKLKATQEQKLEILTYYAGLRTDLEEKENKKKADLEKLRKKQILGDAKNTFNQIANLAGKDSKVGKALALASATISGVEGVQNAYTTAQKSPITTFFPAYPIVQAALAGAVAAKNIATIKKTDPTGGGTVATPSVSAGSGSAPAPPSFNIVGASDTNQLADAIGGQTQQPVQAFVVANDVTTAQSLENNIVEGATL
tara:strand:- start:6932 stop:8773 length:1842 start_codon:yes stop_codon:yes gene_type:complete